MSERIHEQPAFPQLSVEACERDGHGDLIEPFTSVTGGMTLRQYYAGLALLGMGTWTPSARGDLRDPDILADRARWACKQADALLAALTQEQRP
ncbi:MAG: hypothetical protein Q8M31_12425 [Beijerinckiaceae bacterium]|nr:hypothetical protein [Beijerinckiaceae bacterium]